MYRVARTKLKKMKIERAGSDLYRSNHKKSVPETATEEVGFPHRVVGCRAYIYNKYLDGVHDLQVRVGHPFTLGGQVSNSY